MKPTIHAAPIVRDVHGWFVHPQLPRFKADDEAAFSAWIVTSGIEVQRFWMHEDAPDLARRYQAGKGDCTAVSNWNPTPLGPDWWLLALCDSYGGPVAYFARPAPAIQQTAALQPT